ncbi:hypothetical protein [Streptomyces niveus]|uniref:hypothetical protein n=1 Tax=Streptomyces niveus TaxID=193462 RepID=UPI000A8720B1
MLVDAFYEATCRAIEELPSGLDEPDRDRLAELLARVVRDNEVPAVFAGTPSAGG